MKSDYISLVLHFKSKFLRLTSWLLRTYLNLLTGACDLEALMRNDLIAGQYIALSFPVRMSSQKGYVKVIRIHSCEDHFAKLN